MNLRLRIVTAIIPSLTFLGMSASAQVPTTPPVGQPVTIQTQTGANGQTSYSVAQPGTNGAQQAAGVTSAGTVSRQVPQDFKLSSGDVISVRVFDQADYSVTAVIDRTGFVQLPYLGQVQLADVSIRDAEASIASKLVEAGIYNDPTVQVQFIEGPGTDAVVLGELHGAVPIFNERPLLDVIGSLGGFPASASHVVTINRPGQEPKAVDLGSDPFSSPLARTPIYPGDTIITGRAGVVFVVGAFKNPGVVPLTGNQVTTMLQLCATIGGPVFQAKYDDLRLIRVVDGKRTLVTLNIDHILKGKDPDPILKSNDILFLPTSAMKTFINGSGLQTVLSLVTTAIAVSAITR